MAANFDQQKQLESVFARDISQTDAPSLDLLSSLKSLAFFEDRLRAQPAAQRSLIDNTAAESIKSIKKGMYVLQNNEDLAKALGGRGLKEAIIASKIVQDHEKRRLFDASMNVTIEAAPQALRTDLDLGLEANLRRIGRDQAYINGLFGGGGRF